MSLFDSSLDNFTLCASPPDKVVADCPSFIYERPTSIKVFSFFETTGTASKNEYASSIVIWSISWMFLPLYVISRVSLLYLLPSQISQGTYISGRKCISTLVTPSP